MQIKAYQRTADIKANHIRNKLGKIPAILYCKNINIPIYVDQIVPENLEKAQSIFLDDGRIFNIKVQSISLHTASSKISHIDFLLINSEQ